MAQQGAALQTYNNELVRCLEELCARRQSLQADIDTEQQEKTQLETERARIEERLQVVDATLSTKLASRAEYDRIIAESEQAYLKILESSQLLVNLVKTKSQDLHDVKKPPGHESRAPGHSGQGPMASSISSTSASQARL